jgi:hypothetical protein
MLLTFSTVEEELTEGILGAESLKFGFNFF